MDKNLKVKVKDNYGVPAVYPDCDTSKMLCELAGTKTLTGNMLMILKRNGFTLTAGAWVPGMPVTF